MRTGVRIFGLLMGAWFTLAATEPRPSLKHQPQAQSLEPVAQPLSDIATALRTQVERPDTNKPCLDGKDDHASDLCAQWKAADAANSAAQATWLFGIFGTVIGAFTLAAATAAAIFAKKAADHTEAGALAARQANDLNETNAQRELRPYIWPAAAWFEMAENGEPIAHVQMKNYGQTPALNKRGWDHTWLACFPLCGPLPDAPDNLPMGSGIIGPGQTSDAEQPHGLPLDDRARQEIHAGRTALYLYGQGTYLDVFGKEHFYRYIYFATGEKALERGRFAAYTSGNVIDVS